MPEFFIDKYEVTNKAFKRFVDAGGYRERAILAAIDDDRRPHCLVEEAVAEFRDTTGRPGPSTWELGTYPEGQDDWPVRGVSWYEAAAYAQFAGKSLPTVHHWRLAAAMGIHSAILEWSNFSGKGPARAGEYLGIGPYGTFDMAGNVKEWCANAVRDRTLHHGRRVERAELSVSAGGCATRRATGPTTTACAWSRCPTRPAFRPRPLDPSSGSPATTASKSRSATTCSARSRGCIPTTQAI